MSFQKQLLTLRVRTPLLNMLTTCCWSSEPRLVHKCANLRKLANLTNSIEANSRRAWGLFLEVRDLAPRGRKIGRHARAGLRRETIRALVFLQLWSCGSAPAAYNLFNVVSPVAISFASSHEDRHQTPTWARIVDSLIAAHSTNRCIFSASWRMWSS